MKSIDRSTRLRDTLTQRRSAEAFAPRAAWPAAASLLLVLLLLGLLFHAEIAAAIAIWISSTAYNHCVLIIPIAAYLIWERRAALVGLVPAPSLRPLPLLIPLAVLWLVAERLGIMEVRQFVLVSAVEIAIASLFGWRLFLLLLGPLLYLYFLVPFGAFLVPALQNFTARFVVIGLDVLGIPNFSDGVTIDIPQGRFYVAEACAGLRFLIASMAFSVLYALLIYRGYARRMVFILIACCVPVIANGFRALGIVSLGYLLGSAEAAETDHILYGWIFFSIVIVLLILLGLPFRQAPATPAALVPPAAPMVAPPTRRLVIASLLFLLLAGAGPLLAAALATAGQGGAGKRADLAPLCVPVDAGADRPIQRFGCGATALPLLVEYFPPRSNPRRLLDAARRLSGALAAEDVQQSALAVPGAVGWTLVATRRPARLGAFVFFLDGIAYADGLHLRLRQALNSLSRHPATPLLIVIEAPPGSSPAAIRQFLGAHAAWIAQRLLSQGGA